MGGGMEVSKKNRFIEEWNACRKKLEFNFRCSRRNLAIVGIFCGVAVPILVFKGIAKDLDEDARRKLLLDSLAKRGGRDWEGEKGSNDLHCCY